MENEIPKHKKKKIKTVTKSNHKHVYEDCLVLTTLLKTRHFYVKGQRCDVCGKIGELNFIETERTRKHSGRMLSQEEVLEKYKHLKKYNESGIWIQPKEGIMKYSDEDLKNIIALCDQENSELSKKLKKRCEKSLAYREMSLRISKIEKQFLQDQFDENMDESAKATLNKIHSFGKVE